MLLNLPLKQTPRNFTVTRLLLAICGFVGSGKTGP